MRVQKITVECDVRDTGGGMRGSGYGIRDAGCVIRDARYGMCDV